MISRRGIMMAASVAVLLFCAMLPAPPVPRPLPADIPASDREIIHLLNRIGFGPRPGDPERVRRMGIDAYIELQLHPERIDDGSLAARLAGFAVMSMPIAEAYRNYPQQSDIRKQLGLAMPEKNRAADSVAGDTVDVKAERRMLQQYYQEHDLKAPKEMLNELQGQRIVRAVHSGRQLQEVMTDFWLNHFNIFWGKGGDKWMMASFETNAIRPNALGNFRDLLMATAKSPAMLFYLDNYLSASAQRAGNGARAGRKSGINENYAREIMELHTLGVDGGYTQRDVQEVARCFTGWTIDKAGSNGGFIFRPKLHDDGAKQVLGVDIPAGGGISDGEKVIDILARQPGTARFIATKLVRRFVADGPPQSLVNRVADVYTRTGGDIAAMLGTILTSNEFRGPEAYRAKIKSPFELAVSAIRALDGGTDGSPRIAGSIAKMGEALYMYQPPTGYPDRAAQWVNTGALAERLNFGQALAAGRIPGTTVNAGLLVGDGTGIGAEALLERAVNLLLGGDISSGTRAVLQRSLNDGVAAGNRQGAPSEAARVIGLVLGTPEFQRR
ncbi:MAG: hypothetical protein JWQ98_3101 [Chlorobi bacterium]|nr:hypothetical protein [Chlorobiota bacterium]